MEIQPIRITDKSEDKFDLEEYCDILLQALEEGFAFQTFSDYLDNPQRKVILLRHDIDVSLEYGMQMARIEQHLGITSTFFVRLHSYFYNLLEEENMKRLAELAEMNFEVGIHQEIYKFTADRQELIDILKIEKKLVEAIIGKQILGVATHLPKKNVIKMTPDFLAEAGFRYRPGSEIFNQDAIFISDSNKKWKRYSFREALAISDKILANIHPVWWAGKFTDHTGLIKLLSAGK